MIIEGINIDSLLRAFARFQEFHKIAKTEIEQAGLIQAFEYTYELTWKTMKRFLEARGKIANSPREVFRMAALETFIDDPELWFDFVKMRNLTVHIYDENEIATILSVLPSFENEVEKFITKLQNKNASH